MARRHGPFDVIIEDGSHIWDHQITTLRTLFPFLTADGLYIVEDLQTNYGTMAKDFRGNAEISCVEFLKKWLDLRVGDDLISLSEVKDDFLRTYGRAVHSLTFYRRACLIRKQYSGPERVLGAGRPIAPSQGAVPVHVTAHVSYIGDVLGSESFVNLGNHFQGFEILTDVAMEYQVKTDTDQWTDWVTAGNFPAHAAGRISSMVSASG